MPDTGVFKEFKLLIGNLIFQLSQIRRVDGGSRTMTRIRKMGDPLAIVKESKEPHDCYVCFSPARELECSGFDALPMIGAMTHKPRHIELQSDNFPEAFDIFDDGNHGGNFGGKNRLLHHTGARRDGMSASFLTTKSLFGVIVCSEIIISLRVNIPLTPPTLLRQLQGLLQLVGRLMERLLFHGTQESASSLVMMS